VKNQNVINECDSARLDEYDFSNGVRGKYVDRFAKRCNVVILDPDVAADVLHKGEETQS
jgi:hypothetical protein